MTDADKTLETNTIEIAVLKSNMEDIKREVKDTNVEVRTLSTKIDALITTKIQETADIKVETRLIADSVKRLEQQSTLWKWLTPTLSAIFSGIIVFLIISYLQTIK